MSAPRPRDAPAAGQTSSNYWERGDVGAHRLPWASVKLPYAVTGMPKGGQALDAHVPLEGQSLDLGMLGGGACGPPWAWVQRIGSEAIAAR